MSSTVNFTRIQRLPDELVNRIAAGEVIERPASVVKELVENSLDANATEISIEIKNGGTQLIRITDNGTGIHHDDLQLAIDRHTTSKLFSGSDLARISTLGFRGEALSSIAAVAGLKLISRQSTAEHAWTIDNSGKNVCVKPAAHPPGTSVEVTGLFARLPARRKFLRSEKTEFIHIHELIKKLALSRVDLSIKFINNGRQVLLLRNNGDNPEYRLNRILGKKFMQNCIAVNRQAGDLHLYGWLAHPDNARSQSDQQNFYLNGRMIKDKLVSHAIKLAVEPYLYSGRYPGYVLYLDMDLANVDINVHPAKHEVRFRHSQEMHNFIYGSLSMALEDTTRIDNRAGIDKLDGGYSLSNSRISNLPVRESRANYNNVSGKPVFNSISIDSGHYLITEYQGCVYLIDLYQFREQQLQCEITDKIKSGKLVARPLLVPLLVNMPEPELELIEKNLPLLEKFALVITRIGPTQVQIRSFPAILKFLDPVSLVCELPRILGKQIPGGQEQGLVDLFIRHVNDCAPEKPDMDEQGNITCLLDELINRKKDRHQDTFIRKIDNELIEKILGHEH